MCMAGGVGASVALPDGPAEPHAMLFGEDQARYCIAVRDAGGVMARAAAASVPAVRLGRTGGPELTVAGRFTISVADLRAAHERTLPDYMAGPAAAAAAGD
jgi:phosphoribosylformylglycinamidine synthase